MPSLRAAAILVLSLCAAAPSIAQAPQLKPGEAFLTLDADGKFHEMGDAKTPRPLGEMAKFVWLKIAGAD